MTRSISVTVNGQLHEGVVEDRLTLADFLRQDLRLTGTHLGCEHGVCGACTVLMNGQSVRSCLMLAAQAHGQEITTIEGLGGERGAMHPIQEAFAKHFALQCGFCTPGFVMTLVEFLRDNTQPTEEDVKVAISGNLCRCTGYRPIIDATLAAAKTLREGVAS
jgi:carbon-monoxide dehydrogenase small subunit